VAGGVQLQPDEVLAQLRGVELDVRRLLALARRRQQHGGEHAEDPDHDQQLDQREAGRSSIHRCRLRPRWRGGAGGRRLGPHRASPRKAQSAIARPALTAGS
jgi:hypothetical protein